MSKPLVLYVEDNDVIGSELSRFMANLDLSVIWTQSKTEALRQVFSSPTLDFVVCDANLVESDPDNDDGVEFANEIREMFSDVRMIGYTGKDKVLLNGVRNGVFEDSFEKLEEEDRLKEYLRNVSTDLKLKTATVGDEISYDHLLRSVTEKLAADEGTLAALRSFEGYFSHDNQSENFGANDKALVESGYKLMIIYSPNFQAFTVCKTEVSLRVPLPIWYRHVSEGWHLEIFGYHGFNSSAKTRKTGLQSLLQKLLTAKLDNEGFDVSHKEFADGIVITG